MNLDAWTCLALNKLLQFGFYLGAGVLIGLGIFDFIKTFAQIILRITHRLIQMGFNVFSSRALEALVNVVALPCFLKDFINRFHFVTFLGIGTVLRFTFCNHFAD